MSALGVRLAVADDVTVGQVERTVQVRRQHRRPGLACGAVVLGKRAVDVLCVELYALAVQNLQHQVVGRPEVGFGVGGCAQSVLVRHHHEQVVGVVAQEAQGREDAGHEAELLERIYLLVLGFAQDGAVAVYE